MRARSLLVCVALLLVGCASSGTDFDSKKVSQIQKGVTTQAELITMFGDPVETTTDSNGLTHMTWTYMEAHANGASYIPYYGMFKGGSNTSNKSLNVTLKDGVVTDYSMSQGAIGSRRGD